MVPALHRDLHHYQVFLQKLVLHLTFRVCQKVNLEVFKPTPVSVNKWNSSNF